MLIITMKIYFFLKNIKRHYSFYLRNFLVFCGFIFLNSQFSYSQSGSCAGTTPYNTVDLTLSPTASWTSGNITRNGLCCGLTGTSRCVEFEVDLHSSAIGIKLEITSGTIPGGSHTYKVNCGSPIPLGQATCINGPGPHYVTVCLPNSGSNKFRITSIFTSDTVN